MLRTEKRLSIVLADDHPVVLHGLAALLRAHPDLEVVAMCSGGLAAVHAIEKLNPHIAVLDISMPDLSGLEVLSRTATRTRSTKFIVLTGSASDRQILTAVSRGARGIMLKHAAPGELVRCIREVAAGGCWFPEDVVDVASERETGRRNEREHLQQSLTSREVEIMMLVSQGLANKEIGRRLNLAEGTIKIHLHNIYKKTGVRNRAALTALAPAYREYGAERSGDRDLQTRFLDA